jgi:hypothetical protein
VGWNAEAARTGASTKDLMVRMIRMGDDSPSAALTCQHATNRADRAIADALSDAVAALRGEGKAPSAPGAAEGRAEGRATTARPGCWPGWANGTLMARRPGERAYGKGRSGERFPIGALPAFLP